MENRLVREGTPVRCYLQPLSIGLICSVHAEVSLQPMYSFGPVWPTSPLTQVRDGSIYGTTQSGGARGFGSVFRLTATGEFKTICSFTAGEEGFAPTGGLVEANDGSLHGTALGGGGTNETIFRVTTNGLLSGLHSFPANQVAGSPGPLTLGSDANLYGIRLDQDGIALFRLTPDGLFTSFAARADIDGSASVSRLLLAKDGNFYGTTTFGGSRDYGTVFRVKTNGTFTTIQYFDGQSDGGYPARGLVQASDGTLYGTTSGSNGMSPTVFKIMPNGVLTTLYAFDGDWSHRPGILLQGNDGNLYGSRFGDGRVGPGALFQITTDGAFTTLFSFTGGADGVGPNESLLLAADGDLYGTSWDWYSDSATIFRISPNGKFSLLHSFSGLAAGSVPPSSLGDSAIPDSRLVQATDGNLYGTTLWGGPNVLGSIYRVSANGTVANVYSFRGESDGSNPAAGLVQAPGGNLYGTTSNANFATNSNGTVFRITTGGTLTTLHSFVGTDGSNPSYTLLPARDGYLYGTTQNGGINDHGTLFRITTDGVFTMLYQFGGGSDGADPAGTLVQADNGYLYGTTAGINSKGTIFRFSTAGELTTIYSFTGGADGATPSGGLILASDGNMYGKTVGTVFRVTTNGVLTTLHSFGDSGDGGPYPSGSLLQLSDGFLYGTTKTGGSGDQNSGTLFRITTEGSFTLLHSFNYWEGELPIGLTLVADGSLWGVSAQGGVTGRGSLFRVLLNAATDPALVLEPPIAFQGELDFSFRTMAAQSYSVLQSEDITAANWLSYTNLIGDGGVIRLSVPISKNSLHFFRVRAP